MHRTYFYKFSAYCLLALSLVLVTWLSISQGSFDLTVLTWLPTIPLFATFMLGIKVGIGFAAAATLLILMVSFVLSGDLTSTWVFTFELIFEVILSSLIGILFEAKRIYQIRKMRHLNNLLNQSSKLNHIGAWTLTKTGEIHFSDEAYHLHGLTKHSPLSITSILSLYDQKDRQNLKRTFLKAARSKLCWQIDVKITVKSKSRWLRIQGKSRSLPNSVDFFGSFEDVTEQIKLEYERQKAISDLEKASESAILANRSKNEFLANISHEIRTPMNGIIGMTDILLQSPLNADQQKIAQTIQKSSESLLFIINDVIDYSLIESGKIKIQKKTFSIASVIESVVVLFSFDAGQKGIDLEFTIDPKLPEYCVNDEERFRQVLTNIVGNAVKFTEEGGIIVQAYFDNKRNNLKIEVRDTGIGISEDKLPKLFQPFTQQDASATRRHGGSGLGLVISKRLLKLMDGEITYSRNNELGSTFSICLPLGEIKSISTKNQNSLICKDFTNISILVAEDNSLNQKIVRSFLNKIGVEYTVVENGQKAFELLEQKFFDIILMDIQMPVMDGKTAAEQILKLYAQSEKSPVIIAMTANVFEEDIKSYHEIGMLEVIAKPFKFQTFVKTISHFVPDRKVA